MLMKRATKNIFNVNSFVAIHPLDRNGKILFQFGISITSFIFRSEKCKHMFQDSDPHVKGIHSFGPDINVESTLLILRVTFF
jgi:hypothetical protein